MRTRSQTIAARKTLLDLPPEIFTILEAYLEIREIATFILTCRLIKQRLERFLYRKVYVTPNSYSTSTPHFVSLLAKRPEIVPWIQKLVVNEYDPECFPRLSAVTFPNLLNLILEHEGPVASPPCGRRKINALHALVKPQPALQNLTFTIEQKVGASPWDAELYYLPVSASPLFRHPKLVRAHLAHLDFTAFKCLPEDYFCHSDLRELFLERCKYSAQNLQLFLNPCTNLNKLWLSQNHFEISSALPRILHSVKDTLRVLKIEWGHLAPLPDEGMDFRSFPNLHAIIMHPKLLFGKSYMTLPRQEVLELIKSTLPPNLMILLLEGVVPVYQHDDNPDEPDDNAFRYGIWYRGFGDDAALDPIPAHDLNLMRTLLTEKDDVAPKLMWLSVQHLYRMEESLSEDIIDLARRKNVRCCALDINDETAPPLDMSKYVPGLEWDDKEREDDEDSSGFCTILDHSRGTIPWPKNLAGNF